MGQPCCGHDLGRRDTNRSGLPRTPGPSGPSAVCQSHTANDLQLAPGHFLKGHISRVELQLHVVMSTFQLPQRGQGTCVTPLPPQREASLPPTCREIPFHCHPLLLLLSPGNTKGSKVLSIAGGTNAHPIKGPVTSFSSGTATWQACEQQPDISTLRENEGMERRKPESSLQLMTCTSICSLFTHFHSNIYRDYMSIFGLYSSIQKMTSIFYETLV